jgi:cardiolipin synthase
MKECQGGAALRKIIQEQTGNKGAFSSRIPSFYKYIPNALTMLRLSGTPLCLWVIAQGGLTAAFWIFFAICLTDWLDGYLARRWNASSTLGQILDPLADKFLLISLYLTLGLWGFIPLWLAGIVLIRDFLILAIGSGIILSRKLNISLVPQFMGKISTTLQMLFIGLVLVTGIPIPSVPASGIKSILMVSSLYSVALTTILSGFSYARVVFNALRKP